MEIGNWKLLGNFRMFVRLAPEDDVNSVIEHIEWTPIGCALQGQREYVFNARSRRKLDSSVKVQLDQVVMAELKPRRAIYTNPVDGVEYPGVILDLPPFHARCMGAYVAIRDGMPYTLHTLVSGLFGDAVSEVGRKVLKHAKNTKFNGVQMHAGSAPKLKTGHVAVSYRTAALLYDQLAKAYKRLKARYENRLAECQETPTPEEANILKAKCLHGMRFVIHREPVAGKTNARWVTMIVDAGMVDAQLAINSGDWEWMNAGDEDGDIAYLYIPGGCNFDVVEPYDIFGDLKFADNKFDVNELLKTFKAKEITDEQAYLEASVTQVMNACIKDLTGLLDYTIHNIAYASGLKLSSNCPVDQAAARRKRAVGSVFGSYLPVQEQVMDQKKSSGGAEEKLYTITADLLAATRGEMLPTAAFDSFLDNDVLKNNMQAAIRLIGGNLGASRLSAFGKLLATGRKLKAKAFDQMEYLIDKKGIAYDDLLPRLHEDALGENPITLKLRSKKEEKEEEEEYDWRGPRVTIGDTKGVKGLLDIKVDGQPIHVAFPEEKLKDNVLHTRIRLVWKVSEKSGLRTLNVALQLPKFEKLSEYGHYRVSHGSGVSRVYQPIYSIGLDGTVQKINFIGYLREAIAKEIEICTARPSGGSNDRFEGDLNGAIAAAVLKLDPSDNGVSDYVLRNQFQVRTPNFNHKGEPLSLIEKWELKDRLLREVAKFGDVRATSKGMPGDCFSIAGDYHLAPWLLHMNPCARWTERKREAQHKVVQKAIPLAYPTPLSVVNKKYPLAPELVPCVRELVVMYANSSSNLIDADGHPGKLVDHDTGTVFPSGYRKLAAGSWVCNLGEEKFALELMDRLKANGIPENQIRCEEYTEELPYGVVVTNYRVTIDGPLEDAGKVMALVGPFKFVQCVWPTQYYAMVNGVKTEVDVILPLYTTLKKGALDAVIYTMAARAGWKEIDTDLPVEEVVKKLKQDLPEGGFCDIMDDAGNVVGSALVGPLPFYRTQHLSLSIQACRMGENGITVHWHEWVLLGLKPYVTKNQRAQLTKAIKLAQSLKDVGVSASVPVVQDDMEDPYDSWANSQIYEFEEYE